MASDNDHSMNEEDRQLLAVLRSLGLTIPTTPEEVAKLEKELAAGRCVLPERLQSPPDPSQTPHFTEQELPLDLDLETVRALSRAAREGKTIPTWVDERMKRDRRDAEVAGGTDKN